MEEKRFATVMWAGIEAAIECEGGKHGQRELLLQCAGLQVHHSQ